jgi:PAS domain-containing protein
MFANILGNSFQYDILSIVPQPVFLIDEKGDINYMNPQAESFYEPIQLARNLQIFLSIMEDSYGAKLKQEMEMAFHTFQPVELIIAFSSYPLKKFKITCTPYRIHNETVLGIIIQRENRKSFIVKKKTVKRYSEIQQ